MTHTLAIIGIATVWAIGGGALTWLATIPLHRRSLGGLLASVVLTGAVASIAAMVGSDRAMYLHMSDLGVGVIVAVVAGLVAAGTAAIAASRLSRDNRTLHDVVAQIGEGQVPPDDGRRLTAELERLRTELAAMARKLAESRDRERALESARRELVAWVSHDLRTPLAGLRAMSEALEDGVAEEPELYYKQIHASVDRLAGLVDDLFELSRIQAGAIATMPERISLDDLVSDLLAALDPLARARDVRLTGQSSGAAAVKGNGAELNRAITNLVANAIRHTDPGGTVDVRVCVTGGGPGGADGAGAGAEVAVRDECGGIPLDDLARVFDVGFRGEPARTQESGGAGLGLAITRGIVEAHDGSVEVANVAGGCVFTIRLPLA
ncbi:MAG TPA: HAMP domain-containing sensor histidine kinase [Jatrophihabitantaceae bacterium]|jgi:signal transduction histidine kinase